MAWADKAAAAVIIAEEVGKAVGAVVPKILRSRTETLESFCKLLASTAYSKGAGKYNVLVTKSGFDCDLTGWRDVKEIRKPGPWNTVYYVRIVPMGQKKRVIKTGDGGYSNWCVQGRFNRNGNTVDFY